MRLGMDYGEKAVGIHGRGFNCAQSVLLALTDQTGLDESQAAAVATGFGGGMRTGEVCGAVTGGLMALGLTLGSDGNGEKTGAMFVRAKELQRSFTEKYGHKRCAELIRDAGGKQRCNEFIACCARLAAEIIEQKK